MRRPEFDLSARRRERGAALVVSLMLVMALSVLAVAGVGNVAAELAMTRNLALDRGVLSAAASGIELALASAPFDVESDREVALVLGALDEYSVSATIRFAGATPVPSGFSIGASPSGVVAYHFVVDALAAGPRDARSLQHQGFYILGPRIAELF